MKFIFIILMLVSTSYGQYVLSFDGTKAQHVNHGEFWALWTPENKAPLESEFAWEAWVKIAPTMTQGYVISAGYGGAHAILLGFTNDGLSHYRMIGNFETLTGATCASQAAVSFGSDYVFDSNVWYHIAISSKNNVLKGYKNGTEVLSQTWSGTRIASDCNSYDTSAGTLYIGGSNHINFTGSIGAVRGWEGFTPYNNGNFTPEVMFRHDWEGGNGQLVNCVFLVDYTSHGLVDMSNGYNGKHHSGFLHSALYGLWRGHSTQTGFPLPKFIDDSSYPAFAE